MDIERRMESLERQLRWLKRLGALAIAVGAVVVLMGQAADEKKPPHLVARSLTIVDKDGNERGRFYTGRNKTPGLSLLDKNGKSCAEFFATPDGSPYLIFKDKAGRVRVSLAIAFGRPPSIDFYGQDGVTHSSLKRHGLSLTDKNGKVIWKAPGE